MPACPQCATEYQLPARFCGSCGTSLPQAETPEEQDPWVGKIVDRRYRVISRIGSGGMGLVYKVEHVRLNKVAAMKVLHAEMARDGEAVRRFRTEAEAVSRLNHPNIVQTFDFGDADRSLYLVMEYVKGDDLAVLVKREGPLPFERTARLFVQICSALSEAHESGVIHRDLKPENIVVVNRRDGSAHAKVLDFGLAKLRERAEGAEITTGGQVIGTPYYMSPEQVRGEPLDLRTDIYSLGATMYRVLTGTPPFEAPTPMGVLTKHVTDPLEPPRRRAPSLDLPMEADEILARAMAKARDQRYATAAEVERALQAAIDRAARAVPSRRSFEAIDLSEKVVSDRVVSEGMETVRLESPARPLGRSSRGFTPPPSLEPDPSLDSVRDPSRSSSFSASASSRSPGPALMETGELWASGGERLRRTDFDAFERSLRRRKNLTRILAPLALLGVIAAGFWLQSRRREKARSSEHEPNDSPAEANLLPLDTPLQGWVGRRLGDGRPDLDFFRIATAKTRRAISARLEGVPNVDLVLELYDGQGAAVGKSDSHRVGGGEWLQPTVVGPGEAFVLVRQIWIQGTPIVEDVADPYRLQVHWGPPAPGWELEPNDRPEQATPMEMGRPTKGYVGRADDQDWYAYPSSGAGRLLASVSAPDGASIALSCGAPPPAATAKGKDGRETREPRGTREIKEAKESRESGEGKDPKGTKPAQLACPVAAGGGTTLIVVSRKVAAAADRDPDGDDVGGLGDPYELTVEAAPP